MWHLRVGACVAVVWKREWWDRLRQRQRYLNNACIQAWHTVKTMALIGSVWGIQDSDQCAGFIVFMSFKPRGKRNWWCQDIFKILRMIPCHMPCICTQFHNVLGRFLKRIPFRHMPKGPFSHNPIPPCSSLLSLVRHVCMWYLAALARRLPL